MTFIGSSVLAGIAPTLEILVAARVLQGIGGGPLLPLSQAILMEIFPPRERGTAMAIWGVGVMFAPIFGPTLGGWITDNYSWRWIFYLNVPIGLVALGLAWLFLREPARARRRSPAWTPSGSACWCWASARSRSRSTAGTGSTGSSPPPSPRW